MWSRKSTSPDLVDKSDGWMIHHLGTGILVAHMTDIFLSVWAFVVAAAVVLVPLDATICPGQFAELSPL